MHFTAVQHMDHDERNVGSSKDSLNKRKGNETKIRIGTLCLCCEIFGWCSY